MFNPLRKILDQFLNFSRSDRSALLILSALIFVVLIANFIIARLVHPEDFDLNEYKDIITEWEQFNSNPPELKKNLFVFDPNNIKKDKLDSLDLPENVKRNFLNYRSKGARFETPDDFARIYGMNDSIFNRIKTYIHIAESRKNNPVKKKLPKKEKKDQKIDPNTAGEKALLAIGLNGFQVRNILKYRESGGSFALKTDLIKIYGIDSTVYGTIQSHIKIEGPSLNSTNIIKKEQSISKIEINLADSTALVRLKGIGPVYAARIIKYRNLLGGFHSWNQLKEVYGIPVETWQNLKGRIVIDSNGVSRIRINFADYQDFIKHPYLNQKEVKLILDYRKRNGNIKSIDDLKGIFENNPDNFERIKPYLTTR